MPLIILAGKEYGSGSSRDWAAKGPKLLGVRAVIAESFERIHRSNLVGMGILPLQFEDGQNVASLGLTGEEVYDFALLTELLAEKFVNGRALSQSSPNRPTAQQSTSPPKSASTPRRRSSTSNTAASCNMCCEDSPVITSGSREKSKAPELRPGPFHLRTSVVFRYPCRILWSVPHRRRASRSRLEYGG